MPRNFETEDTDQLNQELDRAAPVKREQEGQAIYRVMGEDKIPVSKHHGKVWQGRKEAGKQARTPYEEAWIEAVKYFMNDQLTHRTDRGSYHGRSGNENAARQTNNVWSETENIIFANTTTLLPALYAKNPLTEFTAADRNYRQFAVVFERLINTIFWMKSAPGVNLKPKARKAVLNALLTNCGWLKIGWNFKESSAGNALEQIAQLSQELMNAKEQSDILEIEGKLMALERHMDVLEDAGPFVKFVSPFNHIIDPEAEEPDLSDCRWMMECMYLSTEYVNARYGMKDEDGNVVSVYKPTHVLKNVAGKAGSDIEHEVNNFSLFDEEKEAKAYGYKDEDSYKNAQRTLVWMCWDKTTRRVYMFADNDWKWPLWVWSDPYQLNEFFPYYSLAFYDNPEGWYGKGEVTYYLDQQDAINEINDEERRARLWAKRNILFDKNNIQREDVEAYLNGPDGTARGVDLPEGMKMEDVVYSVPMPSMRFPELFDPSRKLQAIDRISSVSDVMRGAQFKANTTNDAVETYNSQTQTRLDEKVDKIEDFIGVVGWGLAQLCVQFMSAEEVQQVVGPEVMEGVAWTNMPPRELANRMTMRVVGGSTAKPTSQAKKREAVEAGQVLGQFADASPAIVEIMLRMFQQAFDEIVIKDEDWQFIRESIIQGQQQAGAGPAGAGGGGGQELPPEAQQAVETAVQRGVPREQAMQMVMSRINQQAQGSA